MCRADGERTGLRRGTYRPIGAPAPAPAPETQFFKILSTRQSSGKVARTCRKTFENFKKKIISDRNPHLIKVVNKPPTCREHSNVPRHLLSSVLCPWGVPNGWRNNGTPADRFWSYRGPCSGPRTRNSIFQNLFTISIGRKGGSNLQKNIKKILKK